MHKVVIMLMGELTNAIQSSLLIPQTVDSRIIPPVLGDRSMLSELMPTW